MVTVVTDPAVLILMNVLMVQTPVVTVPLVSIMMEVTPVIAVLDMKVMD